MKAAAFIEASNAGEFSPSMEARVSYEKYPAAVSRALNLIATPQGGLTFRPGTRFIAELKSSASEAALYGFEPRAGRGYMLEFGEEYVRFYRAQSQMMAEATTAAITNGTFTTNITGWTDLSTGSGAISHSGGRMLLASATDGYSWAQQAVTVSGATQSLLHIVRFTLGGNQGATATVQVGTSSGDRQLFHGSRMGLGSHTIAFIPGATPFYLQFINKSDQDPVFVDDVEILSSEVLEIVSPYAAEDVGEIRRAAINDVLYLFHDDYPPYKLERRGDASWSLVRVFFEDGPYLGINPEIDLAETDLIRNGTFDSGVADWTTTGDFVDYDGEQKVVFLRRLGTSGSASIEQAVATGSSGEVHVLHFQIVGAGSISLSIGTTSGGVDIVAATDYVSGWYSVSFTPGVATFYVKFIGDQDDDIVGGVGGAFCYNERANLLQPDAREGTVTVTALGDFEPFAATDVGRMLRLEWPGREPGWGIITAFSTSQVVSLRVYRELPSTTPTETWRLGAWSDTTGWPHTGTFYQQRLFTANTTDNPQTLWASASQDFENFRPDTWNGGAVGVEDDNALDFTLAANKVSPILWFAGTRKLLVGTATGQWAVTSRGAALTPNDFTAEPQTSVDGADISPVQIDNVALFVERGNQALDDIGYNFEIDGFSAADLNVLADHIAGTGIVEITYQPKPHANVWARREDGKLACLTYKRVQNVVGWTPVEIAGSSAGAAVVESLATVTGGEATGSQTYDSSTRNELWMIVNRTINGSTFRSIEMMEGYLTIPNRAEYATKATWQTAVLTAQKEAFHVDCGITYEGSATTSITGLSHLNGETVAVWGDGLKQASKVVSGGAITIDTAASVVQVGLSYNWKYRSLKLPYGAQQGSSVGAKKTPYKGIGVFLGVGPYEYTVELDDDPPYFTAEDLLASNGALFVGEDEREMGAGYGSDPRLLMRGSSPYPWTMLGMLARVQTNET